MPTRSILRHLAALVVAAFATCAAHAGSFALSGHLIYNTDVILFDVTVNAPSSVTIWTDSWQAGLNFDPTMSLFGANQSLITTGDDTPDPAALHPGQGGYDSQIQFASLAAGHYLVSLSASGNDPVGTTLGDGFSLAGTTPVLIADWNQPSYDINANDQKGNFFQVHFSGVDQVSAVPEPSELALMLAGFVGVAAFVRRKRTAATS